MSRYDRVPTTDDDAREQQQYLAQAASSLSTSKSSSPPPFRRTGRFLPDLTNTIRTKASSLVSEISGSHNNNNSNSSSNKGNDYFADSSPLLPMSSISSSPSAPLPSQTSMYFQDTQQQRENSSINNNGSISGSSSGSRSQRIISHQSAHVRLLRLIWFVALLVGEHGTYWAMVRRCAWPENSAWDKSDNTLRERYRIALVADPQLTDWMSYHQSGWLLALVEAYTDIYMKRSFHRMHASLRPDAVLFLGDLNDGGRNSHGEVFEKNTDRFFEHVFETRSSAWNQQPIILDAEDLESGSAPFDRAGGSEQEESLNITGHYHQLVDVPMNAAEREAIRDAGRSLRLYVAGNHDVGFGDTLIRSSMARYKRVFGSVNYEVQVGNHSLVVLDTLALSSEVPAIREESQGFLTQISKESHTLPRILFTHVPLFRLPTTSCGNARETKQRILDRKGEQFQNMVSAPLSRQILRGIQPDMVFSGDDHDWCELAHLLDGNLTPEVTLPTFSFAQGIQQPGFVMLSLYNPDRKAKNSFPLIPTTLSTGLSVSTDETAGSVKRPSGDTTFVYEECMLPNQMLIYLCYGVLLAISVNWILIQRFRWMMWGRRHMDEGPILVRWRNSSSLSPSDMDDAAPQGSTTATALSSQLPERSDFVGGSFSGQDSVYNDNAGGRHKKRGTWPPLTSIYWKMLGWDLWNIVRFVVPFYVFLFVVSLM